MKHRIEFSPVGMPCPASLGLAGKRPASSQNWSPSFISGFESGPLSKLNTCGFNFPLFLALFSPPLHEGTRKIVCCVDSATPFRLPKKICLSRAPESSRLPSFHCTLQLREGVSRHAPRLLPRPGGISLSLYLTGSEAWNSVYFPPHLLRLWGYADHADMVTIPKAFLQVLGGRDGRSSQVQGSPQDSTRHQVLSAQNPRPSPPLDTLALWGARRVLLCLLNVVSYHLLELANLQP